MAPGIALSKANGWRLRMGQVNRKQTVLRMEWDWSEWYQSKWKEWCSPDITPPLGCGDPKHGGSSGKTGVRLWNMTAFRGRMWWGGSWVQMVEVCNEVQSLHITLILPGILFIAIPLSLDEELQVIHLHSAVQHLLDFEMFFSLMKNWQGWAVGQPVIGSKGAGVRLITGKMGWRWLKDFRRQRQ